MRMKNFILCISMLFTVIVTNAQISPSATGTTEDLKPIVDIFYKRVINNRDKDAMLSVMSKNFIDHYADPNLPKGIEGFNQFLNMITTAFPDLQVKTEDVIQENNKVVVRLSISGTHSGMLMGKIPPSGKPAVWTGIDILTIENGKITERWSQRDMLSMMKQIGALK